MSKTIATRLEDLEEKLEHFLAEQADLLRERQRHPSEESAAHSRTLAIMGAMRRFGVTRYKAGDVEIERHGPMPEPEQADSAEPWPGAFEQFGKAAREAGYLDRRAAGIEKAAREAGWLDEQGRPTDALKEALFARSGPISVSPLELDDPPEPELPPDEQPPIEIDMEATEKLIREQQEKRRGSQ